MNPLLTRLSAVRNDVPVTAILLALVIVSWASPAVLVAQQEADDRVPTTQRFAQQALPLLQQYCADCHSGEGAEAEWDLDQFANEQDLREALPRWVRVAELIRSRQMPPVDATQPTDQHRQQLESWLNQFLMNEAEQYANDPGPVLLRRLSNSEYNYSIQDLTGVAGLRPAAEFPEDAAAGEGFTNTGSGQGMSAAMAQKYLDAAKDVATHLVLLPDGIRFSEFQSRRDQTDRLIQQIQDFYDHYSQRTEGMAIQLQEVRVETNGGGRIPLLSYLRFLRDHLGDWPAAEQLTTLAQQEGLSLKYLSRLYEAMQSESLLWKGLAFQLRGASDSQLDAIVQTLHQAQDHLWQFHPVGQLGREGTPEHWIEFQSPLSTRQELELEIPSKDSPVEIPVELQSQLIFDPNQDGSENNNAPDQESIPPVITWRDLRIQLPDLGQGGLEIPLVAVNDLHRRALETRQQQWSQTLSYLQEIRRRNHGVSSAGAWSGDEDVLQRWQQLLGLLAADKPIDHLFVSKMTDVNGNGSLQGWGKGETPNLVANLSAENIPLTTQTVPTQGVTVHPSPSQDVVLAWRCPTPGSYRLGWTLRDRDQQCGNGFQWRLEWWHQGRRQIIDSGDVENGQSNIQRPDRLFAMETGDVIRVIVGSRNRDYVCDTTEVDFWVQPDDAKATQPRWKFSTQVLPQISQANPLPDTEGHTDVWWMGWEESLQAETTLIDDQSLLGQWRSLIIAGEVPQSLQQSIERWVDGADEEFSDVDRNLRSRLLHLRGPLSWLKSTWAKQTKLQQPMNYPTGQAVSMPIPGEWVTPVPGSEPKPLLVLGSAELSDRDSTAVVQAWLQTDSIEPAIRWDLSFLTGATGRENHPFAAQVKDFAETFPAALCYRKIVPVDEVVTLALFHREDRYLQQLMLDQEAKDHLDQLWEELIYVSQEPLQLVVSLEQLIQFATQDRQDLVGPFEALREPTQQRAEAFVQQQVQAEPVQLEAVLELAASAWRHPVSQQQRQELRDFYQVLRQAELEHEPAIQLVLARILSSPDFLFKLEAEPAGDQPQWVDNQELATRLSFFLNSSLPDRRLADLAAKSQLISDAEESRRLNRDLLQSEARRLLAGSGSRRLAIEFACQWLHIRGFDQVNDKNESLFPEFANLRDDMYEEAIVFFARLFQDNRSILEIIDSERMYLNRDLADHYEIPLPSDTVSTTANPWDATQQWQEIPQASDWNRGGVLGMATILASQSGASRTSPILRGNWVYETLLGQKLPKPPAGVPVLPEELPEGLSARQLIERHSSDPACANCHIRIDPFGFALESFDVLGRMQSGHDVSTRVEDGTEIEGLSGLKQYLLTQRRDDFVRQFCRKLLGFALGRPLQLSDEPLLLEMRQSLAENDYRFLAAVDVILLSPQFTQKRGQAMHSPLDP